MAQLGQFHLQLALVAAGAQGEDIQDQGGAVQHPALQPAFQVALLHRRQLVVEDHQGSVRGPGRVADLVGLAGAREQGRVRPGALAFHHRGNLEARAGGQQFQFVEALGVIGISEIEGGQNYRPAPIRAFKHGGRRPSARKREESGVVPAGALQHHRARGHHGGDGVLVDHLGDGVLQQHHVLVEAFDMPLELDAVHQIHGHLHLFLTQGVQERVL
jgi:hypothetical protein